MSFDLYPIRKVMLQDQECESCSHIFDFDVKISQIVRDHGENFSECCRDRTNNHFLQLSPPTAREFVRNFYR